MVKKDFIYRVAEENNLPLCVAKAYVNTVFETLFGCMLDNEDITLTGFGRFKKHVYPACQRKTPDQRIIDCPPKTTVKFYPSDPLRDAVATGMTSRQYRQRMQDIRQHYSDMNKRRRR